MLDHLGLDVADYPRSRDFYKATLAPLGLVLKKETPQGALFGHPDAVDGILFIAPAKDRPTSPLHFAFRATSRADVDAFYKAAIAAGGRDNGAPGLRSKYHPNYYACFLHDPDGHNIEAVCHDPE